MKTQFINGLRHYLEKNEKNAIQIMYQDQRRVQHHRAFRKTIQKQA